MPFLKLPLESTLPQVSLTPDQVKHLGTVTLAEARRMACRYPEFRQILHCQTDIELTDQLKLVRGESILLASTPFKSSHHSFDIYQKDFFISAYVGVNCSRLLNAAQFLLDDGTPVFDMAMLFAANMRMQPTAELPTGVEVYFNQRVDETINQTQDVKVLHESGIAVLLSVLPSHDKAGWSCFDPSDARDVAAAEAFVEQLAHIVDAWDLDGIDIDNEYSKGTDYPASLTMVTNLLMEKMPGKIISGAWQPGDADFFIQNPLTVYEPEPEPEPIFWRGGKLIDQLHYSWDMAYYDHRPENRMFTYSTIGIPLPRLAIGFSEEKNPAEEVAAYLARTDLRQQVGGVMVYELRRNSRGYVSTVTKGLLGQETRIELAQMKTWTADGFPQASGISDKCPPEGCRLAVYGYSNIMVGQPADCFVELASDIPLEEIPVQFTFDAGTTGLAWPQEEIPFSVTDHSVRKHVQLPAASAAGVAKVVASAPLCKPATFSITVSSRALKFIGEENLRIFTGETPSPLLIVRAIDHLGNSAGEGLRVRFLTSITRPLLSLAQSEADTDAEGYASVAVIAGKTAGYTSVSVSLEGAEAIAIPLYIIRDRRITFSWGETITFMTGATPSAEVQLEDFGLDGMDAWSISVKGIRVEFSLEPGSTGLTIISQDDQTRSGGIASVTMSPAVVAGKAMLTVSTYHAVSQTMIIEIVEQT